MNDAIAFSLIHAARRIEARLEEALEAAKLTSAKFAAINALIALDRPVNLSELAEKLTCVRSNVTQLVDRLEADGLVRRSHDPDDRRTVRAEVTKLGRERHSAGQKAAGVVLEAIAKELSAIDPKVLREALDSVR